MSRWRGVFGLLVVVLVVGLAGCGAPTPPPAAAPSPAAPSSRLPARPAELRMDGVAPCALLTPAQVNQLGLESGDSTSGGDEFNSPVCQWTNYGGPPDNRWLARLITRRGADYALDSQTGVQVVQIDGFATVQTSAGSRDPKTHCILLVDVAQGQSLWVQYSNLFGDYPKITHEVACGLARNAAQMMVTNLRALAR